MSFERIIFTDPNIPGIMKPVNNIDVEGGDIDDLFMILDAVFNSSNTLIVIGGEKGLAKNSTETKSRIRYQSFMNALEDELYKIDEESQKNNVAFMCLDDFSNTIKEYDCFIFCPINEKVLEYSLKCKEYGKNVFMQGRSIMDFNIKNSYSTKEGENDVVKQLINNINNNNIQGIDSVTSGIHIGVNDIKHQFIDIAKKTTLAKALGLGGIKKFLYGFYLCNGDNENKAHSFLYQNGLDFQNSILNILGTKIEGTHKGNNSIPFLNGINTFYKRRVIECLRKEGDKIENLKKELFPSTISEKLLNNIDNFLGTKQNPDNSNMKDELKVILIIIFGYAYKLCKENLTEIFDINGDIKEFNQVDVNKLTKDDNLNEISNLYNNIPLWDYVGFLSYKDNTYTDMFNKLLKSKDKVNIENLREVMKKSLSLLLEKYEGPKTFQKLKPNSNRPKNMLKFNPMNPFNPRRNISQSIKSTNERLGTSFGGTRRRRKRKLKSRNKRRRSRA